MLGIWKSKLERIVTKTETSLAPGDWIIHYFCGVGRVRGTEFKSIGGKENNYYRIEMLDSTVWYPVDAIIGEGVREISERNEFQLAIDALKEEPEEMSANISIRRGQISKVLSDNAPVSTACMIRDLWGRHENHGSINQTESHAYRSLCNRLIQEWALSKGIMIEEANNELQQMIRDDQGHGEFSLGPIEERRMKEQDRLLDKLISWGGAREE